MLHRATFEGSEPIKISMQSVDGVFLLLMPGGDFEYILWSNQDSRGEEIWAATSEIRFVGDVDSMHRIFGNDKELASKLTRTALCPKHLDVWLYPSEPRIRVPKSEILPGSNAVNIDAKKPPKRI